MALFIVQVLQLIKDRANICNQLHLPAQSGNNQVLEAMRRGYTVEAYRQLVDRVRSILPGRLQAKGFRIYQKVMLIIKIQGDKILLNLLKVNFFLFF